VADNYAAHQHLDVQACLAKDPRITLYSTPTSASWLNMAEIFFSITTRQAIRRGTFTSVKALIVAIEILIDGWNERDHPFTWTKTVDELLHTAAQVKGLYSCHTRCPKPFLSLSWCSRQTRIPQNADALRPPRAVAHMPINDLLRGG
jgi:hypothetical protein